MAGRGCIKLVLALFLGTSCQLLFGQSFVNPRPRQYGHIYRVKDGGSRIVGIATHQIMAEDDSSYIDYDTFLDPSFAPTAFANTLVLATNDPNDSPLDLNTPLSRVLFDVQEIDTHIDALTSKSALALLSHTQQHVSAGSRVLQELESQLSTLTEGYERLQREVLGRYEAAAEVRLVTDRLWHTVKLGRSISRCLGLGRQLEAQMAEFRRPSSLARKDDHRSMLRAAQTLIALRRALASETDDLHRITVIRTLKTELLDSSERIMVSRSEQAIGQFSMSGLGSGGENQALPSTAPTYAQSEDTRSRTTASVLTLYLLSPVIRDDPSGEASKPTRLISALEDYIKRAITSSLAGLSSALSTLPKLDRALLEVSARCQNIVALEVLLETIKPPSHATALPEEDQEESVFASDPAAGSAQTSRNLLEPLLESLDTRSLPSYFWRTMASQLSARVQKIVRDGGVSARTLRTNRDKVRDSLRECVLRGSELPVSSLSRGRVGKTRNWEREATVMTSAVMTVIGR